VCSDSLYIFIDTRGSLICREENDRVLINDTWNIDSIFRTGIDYKIGRGDISLFYFYERITDNWASLNPEPENISAIQLLVAFNT
ncbi:MAG: hypothetical protein PQJ46_05420, partial [Spirochaetales bacterium]|nr:hypothetical protein [Spirochaetales bacterium]